MRSHSNQRLTTLCLLLTAIGCVDLTPPWESGHGRDAGRDAEPYLDGKVDEFRVYNRALSAEEIQSLFTGS